MQGAENIELQEKDIDQGENLLAKLALEAELAGLKEFNLTLSYKE